MLAALNDRDRTCERRTRGTRKRSYVALIVSIALAGCSAVGSSNSSPDGGTSNSSPDGGSISDGGSPLASADKDTCGRYLTCLNLAGQAAYASELAVYGDSSACWQNSTTSANCASACVSAYDHIQSECNCTSPSSCTLCAIAKLPVSTTLYKATATAGSCLRSVGEVFVSRNGDGKVDFGTSEFPVGPFFVEVNTVASMTCDGASTLSWSGKTTSDTQCGANLTASGTLTMDGSGALSLDLSVGVTSITTPGPSCESMPAGSSCAGTFTLTPQP